MLQKLTMFAEVKFLRSRPFGGCLHRELAHSVMGVAPCSPHPLAKAFGRWGRVAPSDTPGLRANRIRDTCLYSYGSVIISMSQIT